MGASQAASGDEVRSSQLRQRERENLLANRSRPSRQRENTEGIIENMIATGGRTEGSLWYTMGSLDEEDLASWVRRAKQEDSEYSQCHRHDTSDMT